MLAQPTGSRIAPLRKCSEYGKYSERTTQTLVMTPPGNGRSPEELNRGSHPLLHKTTAALSLGEGRSLAYLSEIPGPPQTPSAIS